MKTKKLYKKHTTGLETLSVEVPEKNIELFEQALATVCPTVGIFENEITPEFWRVEGIKNIGQNEETLQSALTLANTLSGLNLSLQRHVTEADGWLARTCEAFPEQEIGNRFLIRGTHIKDSKPTYKIVITLDAGVAFGSGDHESTQGCLNALEKIAYVKPKKILDLGCGSGILAMAAFKLLKRKVLAIDNDTWSVKTAQNNLKRNALHPFITCKCGNGWLSPYIRQQAPFDLVFANILARPLCKMAKDLAKHMAPKGNVILSGLLASQIPMVLKAHQRQGFILKHKIILNNWATLVLTKAKLK